MARKIRPDLLRLGIVKGWSSRWFSNASFRNNLEEDELMRNIINDKIKTAGIVSIDVERNIGDVKIIIKASRPGLIIGRGGKGIEDLTKLIKSKLIKLNRRRGIEMPSINISIEELKRSEVAAVNVAQNIAWDLEKRMPYRRVIKKHLEGAMQNKDILGARISIKGRIGGSEIARKEWLGRGKLPLQTLRANIDYGEVTAFTSYGTIGIKVWLNKGEVFED
ncbi:TPA: 30S ribosomal protein S3 [Patescibacteria group bacterium]|nr:30S ribosomal protein S3 [Patescibacteria group bacterium]|tara:strand:- start:10433 stop:11095 length:663 start_codon:yes stop_codon:yes gene_type:complete